MSVIRGSWDPRTEDYYGERLEPAPSSADLCGVCGAPMPEGHPRAKWCSRACTVYMADLRRQQRNKEEHGATRPRSKAFVHALLWRRSRRAS